MNPATGSAAGDAHVARHRGALVAAVDDEIVALGLAADGFIDGGKQEVITFRCAQWSTKISGIFLTEAHEQSTGTGDAHTIAGFAEIMSKGRDEAEPAAGLRHVDIAGRSPGSVIDLVECELPSQLC